ncbi:MAG: hypothetical protein IJU81_00300 [Bacteroidales bacterium]|nr:hypothetical protein [Bacteroidales bacterium]
MKRHNTPRFAALLFATALIATTGSAHAQYDNDDIPPSYNESVSVIGSYNPILESSFKINVAPMIVDTNNTLQHAFVYDIATRRITSIFQPTRIKAAKITGEPTTKLYNSYFRLGFGNYWTPLLDAYFNSTRSKTLNYGLRLNHLSSWGNIGDKENPALYYGPAHYSNSGISAFCKYLLGSDALLHTDISFNNDYNLLYGFTDSLLADRLYATNLSSRDSLNNHKGLYRSMYNYLSWNLGAQSIKTNDKHLGYHANFNLANLWGNYGLGEFNINLDGRIYYPFSLSGGKHASVGLRFQWETYSQHLRSDYAAMPLGWIPLLPYADTLGTIVYPTLPTTGDTFAMGRNLFRINPAFDLLIAGFNIHAGAKLAIDAFSDTVGSDMYVYPDVVISRNFMDDALNLSVGATGNCDANSWNALRLVNPYVLQGSDTWATSHYDFFLNSRMLFSKRLELNIHASYSHVQDAVTFRPNPLFALDNLFTTAPQDYNQIKAGGDFRYVNDEIASFAIGGNYYYNTTVEKGAMPLLYLPSYDLHAGLNINVKDKVRFNAQAIMLSRMAANYALDSLGDAFVSDTIPMRIGVNAEIEYLHNRALSFFLKFDNILCQRYFYWQNYPSRRITVIGGLTYTIPVKRERD